MSGAHRAAFVQTVANFSSTYELDGIEIECVSFPFLIPPAPC
jgi:hypothetical protein